MPGRSGAWRIPHGYAVASSDHGIKDAVDVTSFGKIVTDPKPAVQLLSPLPNDASVAPIPSIVVFAFQRS
jgi:hypothetical protein